MNNIIIVGMRITLSEKDKSCFYKLLENKDNNIEISNLLLTSFAYTDFINIDELNNRISKENEETAIKNIILDNFEVDSDEFRNSFFEQVKIEKCDPTKFINEYSKLLDRVKFSFGKYSLKKVTYEPYQLFALDDIEVKDDKEISKVGYFDKPFSYSALFEGKNLWMSLNPNEINTMSSSIEKAKGRVLVLGLGMGYITYMLSNKKNVSSITVIERNKENIALFKKFLFPLFSQKTKITIIEDDAINFVNHYFKYDYIFADLWFDAEDGLEYYLKLSEIENKNGIKIDYWLETSLKQMRRRYLIELIKEQLEGSDETWYQSEKEISDRIFKTLYLQTKNIEIKSYDDIKELLQ